ncbi:uncharacterized protein PODANS_2_7100 [Podospora anserina S mat+]|uniref:Podospora anserina S mat+ genomic DNA chromosome 2, supercontig 2 n=1 Tax=Podospora anserina (strain S / ATCC MYA-4624 / DSM 980 / FGSC 10383) TaxID=515849 RepID=B2B693_PODAN|nr:uncharacterized protein PODANS_2_7100 [Podospora anserina S mat+]CAP73318.1 unnamed protein product [Podospora anserina S mat+]CDP25721.1 Putative protein of unknown function [Podospora anserina S mat+]
MLKDIATDLGISTTSGQSIYAEPYKLLIHEEGAMFKAHTDTEKIPGMFGTLIISLPSAHQGGDIVLKYQSQTTIYKTSEHKQSWACWYSDVSHEVLPIHSGYHIVLTFNLAIRSAGQTTTIPRPMAP